VTRHRILVGLGLLAVLSQRASGQAGTRATRSDLVIAANFGDGRDLAPGASLEFRLNRPLEPDEGELMVLIDAMDITAITERTATRVLYRPDLMPLPTGQSEVVVYRQAQGRLTELRRFVLRVMQAGNGQQNSVQRNAVLGNKGQLSEGRAGEVPAPERRTFQDFVLNATLGLTSRHDAWLLEGQSSYLGVSRQEDALRFGTRGQDAPMFDLGSYRINLKGSGTTLSLGHVQFGSARHLVNGFSARGSSLALSRGGNEVAVGVLGGSAQVGWDDPIGLGRANNRVVGISFAREFLPARPGTLRLELTTLDGSVLPLSSFNQGAIVNAEASAGTSFQVSAATPDQRMRLTGGFTRSRFDNPRRDEQLFGDTAIVAPVATTRGAAFVESNVTVLQNTRLPLAGATTMTVGYRHERVDPLFRSIAASVAADRRQDFADATLSFGAITAQFGQGWSRDNLDDVASVLTSRGRTATGAIAIPAAAAFHITRGAAFFPTLSFSLNRAHQYAQALPTNGSFRAQDLPNQVSLTTDAIAQWQVGRWRAAWRSSRSDQDNRQDLRQLADFTSATDAASVGLSLGQGELSLDLARDEQRAKERNELTRQRRVTLNGSYRPRSSTNVIASVSAIRSTPPAGDPSFNSDAHLELSQGVFPRSGAPRGQLFVRYARTYSELRPFIATAFGDPFSNNSRRQWTLQSGLNLTVF
jgi:hypothetical protein